MAIDLAVLWVSGQARWSGGSAPKLVSGCFPLSKSDPRNYAKLDEKNLLSSGFVDRLTWQEDRKIARHPSGCVSFRLARGFDAGGAGAVERPGLRGNRIPFC